MEKVFKHVIDAKILTTPTDLKVCSECDHRLICPEHLMAKKHALTIMAEELLKEIREVIKAMSEIGLTEIAPGALVQDKTRGGIIECIHKS